MCLKIILKVTKNQGFTLSVQDTFFKKPPRGGAGEGGGGSPSGVRVKFDQLKIKNLKEF